MENKLRYTKENYEKAKQVSIVDYVTSRYETYKDGNVIKLKEHDSFVLFPNTNSAYWYSANKYFSNALDFMISYEDRNIVESILELSNGKINTYSKYEYKETKKEISLPDISEDSKRVFAYLTKTRHLDSDIISDLINSKDICQSVKVIKKGENEYTFYNCMFVGKDEQGNIKYASLRSTNTKGSIYKADCLGSDKSYPFVIKGNNTNWVNVFESPIDAISYASLEKLNGKEYKNAEYISLGGVSDKALERYLKNNKNIKYINLCLDNDSTGKKSIEEMKEKYIALGYEVFQDLPKNKDYNLDLIKTKEYSENLNHIVHIPKEHKNCDYVIKYLTEKKGLDKDLIENLVKENLIYQTQRSITKDGKEINLSSAVFTNKEKNYAVEMALYCKENNSEYKKEYSDDEQLGYLSINEKDSNILTVFNNPLSMLTYASLSLQNKEKENLLTVLDMKSQENSIIDFLKQNPNINKINVCFDKSEFKAKDKQTNEEKVIDYREVIYKKICKIKDIKKDIEITK